MDGPTTTDSRVAPPPGPGDPAHVGAWLAAGSAAATGLAFLVPIFLARVLTKGEYGAFKQIDLFTPLLASVILLGLDRSLTNYLPRARYDRVREASTVFWTVVALAVASFVPLALFPRASEAVLSLRAPLVVQLAVYASALGSALVLIAQRSLLATGAGVLAAILPVVLDLPYVAVLAIVAWLGATLHTCAIIVVGDGILVTIAVTAVLARHRLLALSFDRSILRRHLAFAVPVWIIATSQTWSGRIDRLLINTSMSAADFAVYSVGVSLFARVHLLPMSFRDAAAPLYAGHAALGERSAIAALWKRNSETVLPFCVLIAAGQVYLSHLLVPVLFTESFRDAVPVCMVAATLSLLGAFHGLDGVLRALVAFPYLLLVAFASLALRLGLGLAVLPLRSLVLLTVVQCVVSYAVVGVNLLYVRRRLGVEWRSLLPTEGWGKGCGLAVGCLAMSTVLEWLVADVALPLRSAIVVSPWAVAGLHVFVGGRWRARAARDYGGEVAA